MPPEEPMSVVKWLVVLLLAALLLWRLAAIAARLFAIVKFRRLKRRWRRDTQCVFDMARIHGHPAYQAIIGMGRKRAVPLIMEELEIGPDYWHQALKALTGEDPVPPSAAGDLTAIRAAWLDWWRVQQDIGKELEDD